MKYFVKVSDKYYLHYDFKENIPKAFAHQYQINSLHIARYLIKLDKVRFPNSNHKIKHIQ